MARDADSLFGSGLVEAIPDETILGLADPWDRDRDGVTGRAAIVTDRATGRERVGRFGWKAQIATLLDFSGDAYRNEMGITNDLFPEELTFGLSEQQLRICDPIPDPEDLPEPGTGRRGIDNFESFMKFLAPPPRGPITDQVTVGEKVFAAIGCSACHVPALATGPSANPLFRDRHSALDHVRLGRYDGLTAMGGDREELKERPATWIDIPEGAVWIPDSGPNRRHRCDPADCRYAVASGAAGAVEPRVPGPPPRPRLRGSLPGPV